MGAPDFERIVDAHYMALYRFALSLSHSEAAAADLTQQTFYLWASRGHQLREESKVKSWLFTTLYREFLGMHRRESRFPHADLDGETAELPAECGSVADSIDGATVVAALRQIDEIFRVPLTLFYLEQFSYREIAAMLDIPAGTVMSRLSRGKMMLRKILLQERDAKIIPMRRTAEGGAR
ncbi:MAG TPA: RNA polymerase sigma factor [Chthoniobacteraceae bacterium]|jgi:RNA polymerase sigma-70 factor (ECF subfamily)|nr:RNA polymerase sigma factor [Chthoniobacteraceae bacterium]